MSTSICTPTQDGQLFPCPTTSKSPQPPNPQPKKEETGKVEKRTETKLPTQSKETQRENNKKDAISASKNRCTA